MLIKRLAGCFYVPAAALRFLSVGGVIEAEIYCAGSWKPTGPRRPPQAKLGDAIR